MCLDSSRLSDITKEEVEVNLTNRNLPLKKEDPNFKQYRRENFLAYQHELSFYCENIKDKEKLITEQKNLTALLPRQMQSLSTRSVIQKYADEIGQFEKNFCPLLSSNESKHKLDDLLSANSCPGAANCKMLESYIAMTAQNEGIQDETGQFVFSSKMTMSPQLKTIYGIQEGEQGPTIQTRTFTAYNDSPVVKDLTTTTQSFVSNSASRRSSSSTSEKSTAPQFDNVTVTGASTNSDTNYYQNHGKNSKRPIVRRVSRSTSSSGNTKTKDETINEKQSSDLGRPTVTKRVATRDKSKIEEQVDELKDEMIDNLSEQLKEMRNLASKAIDINNQFAPSSASNVIGEVPSGNYVAPANNQYNGQINTNRSIDKVVPSNIIATGQGNNTTSNTRVPSSTGGSQAAVVNVRSSTQSSSKK